MNYRARFKQIGGIRINERRHTGKPLNFVEVSWGIFWMAIACILYVRSQLLILVMAWASHTFDNEIVTAIIELISVFLVSYVVLILAIKIASFAKTRILAMFLGDL